MEWPKFAKMMKQVMFNQFIIAIPFFHFTYMAHVWRNGGEAPEIRILPTVFTFIWQIVVFLMVEEVLFFYFHWLLHHRAIYKVFILTWQKIFINIFGQKSFFRQLNRCQKKV